MYDPYHSRHFTIHTDPVSGIKVAVLSTHIAGGHKGVYFTNNEWSDDGRYMWFRYFNPPAPEIRYAVVDFLTDEIYSFPDVEDHALVDQYTGDIYWCRKTTVYKRTPCPDKEAVKIAELPDRIKDKGVELCVGHLSFVCGRKELLTSFSTKAGCVIGTFEIESGEFREWYWTEPGVMYNHAHANPIDENVCICAHEFYYNSEKKESRPPELIDGIYPRLQILNRDGKRTMLKPYKNFGGHEFWAPDGKSIYYQNSAYRTPKSKELFGCEVGCLLQDMMDGSDPKVVCEVNIPGGAGVWHAHCSSDQNYFVMDGAYPLEEFPLWRGCESTVHFFNRKTGKLFQFLTKNPVVEGWSIENPCPYHIDPHPHFGLHDRYINFTTTICGRVDVAVVSVDQLIRSTE